jgi:phospholipid/cholesterol/gamma-HCH transport system substrate-binding protein
MEKNSHYFIVGLFVSVSFFALIIFVVWLTGTHDGRSFDKYTVYFRDPVSGLQNGANVQYRGINVGKVRDIRLSETQSELIKVDIEIDESTPITRDTDASLATLGITGLAFINLTTPDGKTTEAVRIKGERYPVIEGKGTQLSKLFQDIPDISKQILDMTKKLNAAMNEKNMANLEATIANIQQMSQSLRDLLNDENVANISTSIRNFSEASENIDDISRKFEDTATHIDETARNLNDVITRNKGNIDRFTGDGLTQITEMTRETKDMARTVRRLADRLEKNPSQLLYKPQSAEVEIPK